jgi:capsular exopolysaccharide synthesis family protein
MAVGAAYVLEYFDQTINSMDELINLVPELSIGLIPEIPKASNIGLVVADQPRSRVSDEFRRLRNNLEFLGVDMPVKVIYVSSSIIGEGKSTVATNLALVYAQAEKKVLLIDADMRRPQVHKILGVSNRTGLSDVIISRTRLMDAITCLEKHRLFVLTTGPLPPNPTDILGSNKMSDILNEARIEFDVIILDGPPFMVADAAVLANKSDGVLWVTRRGITRRDALKLAREQLSRAHARILGLVVNDADFAYTPYSYSDYYPQEKKS